MLNGWSQLKPQLRVFSPPQGEDVLVRWRSSIKDVVQHQSSPIHSYSGDVPNAQYMLRFCITRAPQLKHTHGKECYYSVLALTESLAKSCFDNACLSRRVFSVSKMSRTLFISEMALASAPSSTFSLFCGHVSNYCQR